MTSQLHCVLTYTVCCIACGKQDEQSYSLYAGNMEIPFPVTPMGWKTVSGALICPDHKVSIRATMSSVKPNGETIEAENLDYLVR